MNDREWTAEDWKAWRANNVRLALAGWYLGTDIKLDGTIEEYAEKDGVRIRRDPQWVRDADGNYIYGAVS
jgi:hypothetical protein